MWLAFAIGHSGRIARRPLRSWRRSKRLRRQRFTGQQIARDLGVSPATVSRVLHRLGLNRIAAPEPAESVGRYERASPGESIHIEHKRTRPYTPKTNGKADQFVQTSLRGWAYAKAYDTSEQRRSELPDFLFHWNRIRPHTSQGARPPVSRLGLDQNNLLTLHR